MYHFKNLKQNFACFSYFGNNVNSFQFLKLVKHDIYPHFQRQIMRNSQTNIIINSGKLIIDMKKYDKKNQKYQYESLFAEDDILLKTENDRDIILTNRKYILTIISGVYYSFYSYDYTDFQLFFKSNNSITYYTFQNNKYSNSSIETLS